MDARFQQALDDHQPVPRRAGGPAARRRAGDQRAPRGGAAQDLDRQAARRLRHPIGLAPLAGDARQRAARADPGADRPGDGGGRARAARSARPAGCRRWTTRRSTGSWRRTDTAAIRAEAEAKSPRIQSASAAADAARAGLKASRAAYWPSLSLSANTAWNASRTDRLRLSSTSGSSVSASAGTCSTGSTASSAIAAAGRRRWMWPTRPRPTSAGRWRRS